MRLTKNSRILVLGASGMIGSACVRWLKLHGYDKIESPSRSELDLFSMENVRHYFHSHSPEFIILAAGRVGGIIENSTRGFDLLRDNLIIQQNVILSAIQSGVEKCVYFGSSCMYPRQAEQPMKEDFLLTGKPEETSLPYAISKLSGVHMCLSYNKQFGKSLFLPVIPNSTYGPQDDFDPKTAHVLSSLLFRFHHARKTNASEVTLWGSGNPRREFIFSEDVASAVFYLLENAPATDMPLNIGSGKDYSIRELAEAIKDITGFRGSIKWDTSKPDGAPRKLLDSSRINALGWKPVTSLKNGIQKTYDWFLENELPIQKGSSS
ncbi:GDP-L-fucose synthetase [Leptospirillum ferriphilum]|jgi:GDP-L-fucose synthase|uniref:GDP-L-fucose synthase n=1 Tax=Leptospirillum ferriphilum TaxID=178606 RepID=A0A094W830_9BACT|nr:GDP-L-fucose synthase [Leptospirillum ferriphilum]KGA92620.1 GDP-L-fucose synthetase [Leptospirillum ferriphilum]